MPESYQAPNVPQNQITPEFVRDELLRCFESANREFAVLLKMPITDNALRQQVKIFVSTVFSQCGVNYAAPTRHGIELAIAQCRDNAERMMGPQGADIIRHHYAEMIKLVSRLP